jgi:hypothetical protein
MVRRDWNLPNPGMLLRKNNKIAEGASEQLFVAFAYVIYLIERQARINQVLLSDYNLKVLRLPLLLSRSGSALCNGGPGKCLFTLLGLVFD